MVLSVIIVSYNVKYFLEQCLCSVQRAAGKEVEVFVADNHSSDGTVEYLREKFPFVQFISNPENVGFAKANNQALAKAKGKYILFLNPDTIIPEDLFTRVIAFMESHADAGAVGVRMVDGGGEFLKESKRGFPSPSVAFYKMSGLTALFPHSKLFAKYYLGHLHEKLIHEVDVLAGACMFVRKGVLDKTGAFDEQFFMYAEDIDLSYRIQQAGYKNYYYPETTIIHFKGESTRRDSRYVHLFYKAMKQFTRKHFGRNVFLEAAINFRCRLTPARSNVEQPLQKKYWFTPTGDKESCDELPDFPANGSPSMVYCEGPTYSFKQIIDSLKRPGAAEMFFHGKGTRSMVGSIMEREQGETISW